MPEMILCACGCGTEILSIDKYGIKRTWKKGHRAFNPDWKERRVSQTVCGCGCGVSFPTYDSNGRTRKFIRGHASRILQFSITELATRFWKKVEKTDTCWLWTGSKIKGYGQIGLYKSRGKSHKTVRATHAVWFLTYGEWPRSEVLHHVCHVKHCVNPSHLNEFSVLANSQEQAQYFHPICKCGRPFDKIRSDPETGKINRRCSHCLRVRDQKHYWSHRTKS